MKNLILLFLVSFAIVSLSACSDSSSTPAPSSSAAMQPDTKDVKK
jgi:hypothetical protein